METVAVLVAQLGQQKRARPEHADCISLVIGPDLDTVCVDVSQRLCNALREKLPTLFFAVDQPHAVIAVRTKHIHCELCTDFTGRATRPFPNTILRENDSARRHLAPILGLDLGSDVCP